jgi:hypothetical protein
VASAATVAQQRSGGIYLAGQTVFGPAPAVMPGMSLYAIGALDRDALWSPALMLGLTVAWRSGFSEQGGTASFALVAASLDACVVRVRLSVVEARACASGLLGRLTASGSKTIEAASVPRLLAAAGGAAVLTAGLGSMLELSLRLAVGATLVRDSYEFAPNVFHHVASATTQASLGVGLRWR